jgi:glycosyltransferase involved in cell wall biosynthesis
VLAAGLPARWSKALVVVDDCSAPGESRVLEALVERLQQQGNRIELQRHQRNQGKGAALRTGFDRVLGAGPPEDDLVIIQDADLEYDPADYSALMEPLLRGKADAVVGCRFGAHRTLRGAWPRLHAAANRLLTRLSNLATGYRLRDMECCYKLASVAASASRVTGSSRSWSRPWRRLAPAWRRCPSAMIRAVPPRERRSAGRTASARSTSSRRSDCAGAGGE